MEKGLEALSGLSVKACHQQLEVFIVGKGLGWWHLSSVLYNHGPQLKSTVLSSFYLLRTCNELFALGKTSPLFP